MPYIYTKVVQSVIFILFPELIFAILGNTRLDLTNTFQGFVYLRVNLLSLLFNLDLFL